MKNPNVLILALFAVLLFSCGKQQPMRLMASDGEASFGSTFENPNIGAGTGASVEGLGSFSVPTREAVIARLEIGLEGNAKPTTGNFQRALNQVRTNLPKLTDPLKVTGFDQVQLLVYGACSDLTIGATPSMKSKYSIDPATAIAANQPALLAAGLKMLDQHLAGLASESTATPEIKSALTSLISDLAAATPANSTTIAFMSVCIAANTAGSSLMGF